MGLSPKTDEALRDCIDTANNVLNVTAAADGRSFTPNVVTLAANDEDDDFTATEAFEQVFTGDYINCSRDLPDATGLSAGWKISVLNSTSEFLHVYNSDKSNVWHIPAGCHMSFVCTDIGSAAGVWETTDCSVSDLRKGFIILDDFIQPLAEPTDGQITWQVLKSGTGAAISANGYSTAPKGIGVQKLTTGTTATGYASMFTGYLTRIGFGSIAVDFRQNLSALSTVTDEYKNIIGLTNDASTGADTNYVGFEYDRLTSGDFWRIVTSRGGTATATVTSVAPTVGTADNTDFQRLRFEVASTGLRADFWIDDLHVGSSSTNLPLANTGLNICDKILKSAGTTPILGNLDYVSYVQISNNKR